MDALLFAILYAYFVTRHCPQRLAVGNSVSCFCMHGFTLTNICMKFVVIPNGLMLFVAVSCLWQDSLEKEIF